MKDLLVKLSRRVSFKKILRPLFAVQRKRTQNDKGGVLRFRYLLLAISVSCAKITILWHIDHYRLGYYPLGFSRGILLLLESQAPLATMQPLIAMQCKMSS